MRQPPREWAAVLARQADGHRAHTGARRAHHPVGGPHGTFAGDHRTRGAPWATGLRYQPGAPALFVISCPRCCPSPCSRCCTGMCRRRGRAGREALSGAAFATVLFEGAKNLYALAFTLTAFSKDTALYASLGTALGLLLWLFVNASIMLLGAEFGRADPPRSGRDTEARRDRRDQAGRGGAAASTPRRRRLAAPRSDPAPLVAQRSTLIARCSSAYRGLL